MGVCRLGEIAATGKLALNNSGKKEKVTIKGKSRGKAHNGKTKTVIINVNIV